MAHEDGQTKGESPLSMMKDATSFISDNASLISEYAKKGRDYMTGNTFNNMIGQGWQDLPISEEVFVELESKGNSTFLTEARVFYQAQLHLTLYYSLVRVRDTSDFNDIYEKAKKSPFWKFADNSRVKTIGDYALLELCVDCVMLNYLLPRLPKVQGINPMLTSLNDSKIARVFEMIYFRLLRHLCALIEAYLELIGSVARAMMTINRAKFLLTRSLNRQRSNKSAGNLQPRLGSPLPKPASKGDTNALLDGVISTYHGSSTEDDLPLLKLELSTAQGDYVEIDTATKIKRLHRDRVQGWRANLQMFCNEGFDKKTGTKKELEVLLDLLKPEVFANQEVYYHVHKHAAVAIGLTYDIVEKVCKQLYVSDEQKADGVDLREGDMTGETVYDTWEGIIHNVKLGFKHYE